jgi:hypothetical protein
MVAILLIDELAVFFQMDDASRARLIGRIG